MVTKESEQVCIWMWSGGGIRMFYSEVLFRRSAHLDPTAVLSLSFVMLMNGWLVNGVPGWCWHEVGGHIAFTFWRRGWSRPRCKWWWSRVDGQFLSMSCSCYVMFWNKLGQLSLRIWLIEERFPHYFMAELVLAPGLLLRLMLFCRQAHRFFFTLHPELG